MWSIVVSSVVCLLMERGVGDGRLCGYEGWWVIFVVIDRTCGVSPGGTLKFA